MRSRRGDESFDRGCRPAHAADVDGQESIFDEMKDPRRGNTKYIDDLKAEILHRLATDTMLEAEERGPQPKKNRPIDTAASPCLNVHREEDVMSNESSSAVAEPKEKVAKKAKKPAAKHLARSKRSSKPYCINYPTPLMNKIDAQARKAKLSRSRYMLEVAAKAVGFKLSKKAG